MPPVSGVEVKGLKELDRNLANLGAKVAKKIARRAGRIGGGKFQSEMEARAPRDTGFLAGHIEMKVRTGTESGRIRESFGPINLELNFGRDTSQGTVTVKIGPSPQAFRAIFSEFGTAPHVIRAPAGGVLATGGQILGAEVQHPGQPAKPFVRPSFDHKKEEVVDVIGKELWKGIEREAR